MTRRSDARDAVMAFVGSARLAAALSVAAIALGILAPVVVSVAGRPTLIAAGTVLFGLCIASIVARRDSIEWLNLMPISLLAFLLWAAASIFWSQYQWATLGGLLYLALFTTLGLFVALVRDTIQVVRDFGDVIRFVLLASLVLEVFAGLLIDQPIPFLGIAGTLDAGGPITGLPGNRNDLGVLAAVGAVCFVIEWRTRSVQRSTAVFSLVLSGVTLLFTMSPIAWATAGAAVVATVVLWGIRRIPMRQRIGWLWVTLGAATVVAVVVWWLRGPIVGAVGATGDVEFRLTLWQRMQDLLPLHRVEGWGWVGSWLDGLQPFESFGVAGLRENTSALNGYLDVLFQLGIVGLALFVVMLGMAFVRSWLLAARRRSVIFTWPAVVLTVLVMVTLVESTVLVEFGWLMAVVCVVKSSQELSWRTAFRRPLVPEPLDPPRTGR